jgi:hypothetical protein
MAESIKGINVVIGADTTKLGKALGDVEKRSKDISSELKQVEKGLKMDPSSTVLLEQKQKLLGDAVATTTEKLDKLKSVQKQVDEQFSKGEISEGKYRAFQREIAKVEGQLKSYEQQLSSSQKKTKTFADKVKEAGTKLQGVGDKMKNIGSSMSGISAGIAGAFALAVGGTTELRVELAKLNTNAKTAGASVDDMNKYMSELYAVTGETDSNVEGLSNLLASGFKGDQFKQVLDQLSGAAIKFKDTLKFEGLADGLQETLAVGEAAGPFAELLERSGISLDNFNAGLKEAKENGTAQQYVLETLAKTGLKDVYEAYKQNNEELVNSQKATYDFQKSMADLGATLAPIMTKIVGKITELVKWFNNLSPSVQKVIITIAGIASVVGPLLVVIGSIITTVTTMAPVFAAAGAAIAGVSATVWIVIGAIAALIAIGVAIYKNWDSISAFLVKTWTNIKTFAVKTFTSIKDWITTTFSGIWSVISNYINIISTIFTASLEIWKEIFTAAWEVIKTIFATAVLLIKAIVTGHWSEIDDIFVKAGEKLWSIISGMWTKLYSIWSGAVTKVIGYVKNMWTGIKDWFNDGKEKAVTIISGMITSISTFFTELPGKALDWGKNMIQGFIDGITSMARPVISAVESVIGWASDYIGFQSPAKKGEGRFIVDWGENMIGGFVDGINKALPSLERAVSGIIQQPDIQTSQATIPQNNITLDFGQATFVVREEADIKRIAEQLYGIARGKGRQSGVLF